MYIKQATVNNQVGLHARPATFFIQKANEFKSTIWVEKDDRVNAKSLLGVLSPQASSRAAPSTSLPAAPMRRTPWTPWWSSCPLLR